MKDSRPEPAASPKPPALEQPRAREQHPAGARQIGVALADKLHDRQSRRRHRQVIDADGKPCGPAPPQSEQTQRNGRE